MTAVKVAVAVAGLSLLVGMAVRAVVAWLDSLEVEPAEPSGWDELDGVVSGRVMAGRVLLSDNGTGEGS